jgi:hypothetical protein
MVDIGNLPVVATGDSEQAKRWAEWCFIIHGVYDVSEGVIPGIHDENLKKCLQILNEAIVTSNGGKPVGIYPAFYQAWEDVKAGRPIDISIDPPAPDLKKDLTGGEIVSFDLCLNWIRLVIDTLPDIFGAIAQKIPTPDPNRASAMLLVAIKGFDEASENIRKMLGE